MWFRTTRPPVRAPKQSLRVQYVLVWVRFSRTLAKGAMWVTYTFVFQLLLQVRWLVSSSMARLRRANPTTST